MLLGSWNHGQLYSQNGEQEIQDFDWYTIYRETTLRQRQGNIEMDLGKLLVMIVGNLYKLFLFSFIFGICNMQFKS